MAYSAFAYANPPFWIAQALKLFEKYGLDSELVYVSGARPIQAMLGGSIDASQVGGAATVWIGADTAAALKTEARRRVSSGEYFGHIAYMSLVARKSA